MYQKLEIQPKWLIKGEYKVELDKYYTKNEIAEYCYLLFLSFLKEKNIDFKNYIFLEPSAGNGSFFNLLPLNNRIGLDLEPENDEIKKIDFFDWKPQKDKKYLTIGNPPFGYRSWLALEFINKASKFSDFVGFILPMYFSSDGKGSAKSRVKNLNLLYEKELPPDVFYKNGEEISINTVFQIWGKIKLPKKEKIDISNIVEIYTVCNYPTRICGLNKLDKYACFISSTFYKDTSIVFNFDEVNYGSGYGLIIKKHKNKILKILKNTNWGENNIRATNHCKHIGKKHIEEILLNNNSFLEILKNEKSKGGLKKWT